MNLIVATRNPKKLKEIQELLQGFPLKVISLNEVEFQADEVVEDGKTFWENAVKKAMAAARHTPDWVLADDSGLEVEALEGAPGVVSARFAGEKASDPENNRKLLELLRDVPLQQRTARFLCSIAVAHEKRLIGIMEGTCDGTIGFEPAGNFGFGYDPLFIPSGHQQTFAQLGAGVKHQISHRAKAIEKAKDCITAYLRV